MSKTARKASAKTAASLLKLSKVYGRGDSTVHALREVTVDFERGSFTAIMGPSGSGKSTLLQCAAGLEWPTSGEATIGSIKIAALSETELTKLRREQIGFVFQAFNLIQALSAAQNIALPLQLAGRPPKPDVIANALAQVGLADRANHMPSQLSGGQQQRVAIARALVMHPEVLFADEPTGALDTKSSKEVLNLIRKVVDTHGQTVVMVTHDPIAAARADQVLFLADGEIVDLLKAPTAQKVAKRLARLEA